MIELNVPTLSGSALVERIQDEISKAILNITNPTTPAKKASTVMMKMIIKPNEQRNMAEVSVTTSSTLCTPRRLKLPFNEWTNAEAFNIALQACFVESDDALQATDKGLVLKYVSNIKATAETGISDDGVRQAVTSKKGIASVENSLLPNPVTLRPFRTFTEVGQPASSSVFRVRHEDNIKFMLVEADGRYWDVGVYGSGSGDHSAIVQWASHLRTVRIKQA